MRILNVALNGVYTEGLSYHENLLPQYHKKNGNEVFVLASEYVFNDDGQSVKSEEDHSYTNEHGVQVIRLPIKGDHDILFRLKRFEGVYSQIEKIRPDIIFCHLFQFLDVLEVLRYKKNHPHVKLYVDSHADHSNSASNWLSKNILHKLLWRWCAQRVEPYAEKFYGVLPARVDFLKEMYKLPADKCELLVMGADDELVEAASKPEVRARIREQYGIAENDFLVMTGGKIDAFKTQTLLLMQAVKNIENKHIKLIVFGSVTPELKAKVEELADGERVQYIGWIQAKDSYEYFAAADLVVFPGRHSVFWEQVAAQGVPMLCKYWNGTTHVDLGGNVKFLSDDSVEEIQTAIEEITGDAEVYGEMKRVAVERGMKEFAYSDIAKRSIEQ